MRTHSPHFMQQCRDWQLFEKASGMLTVRFGVEFNKNVSHLGAREILLFKCYLTAGFSWLSAVRRPCARHSSHFVQRDNCCTSRT